MISQETKKSRTLRTVALVAGAVGASIALNVIVSMWWLTLVLVVVTIGALYEIWRSGSRLSRSRLVGIVAAATVILTLLAALAAAGYVDSVVAWSGVIAFAFAWIEYVIALSAGVPRSETSRA